MKVNYLAAAFNVNNEYIVELLGDSMEYITTIMHFIYHCNTTEEVFDFLKTKTYNKRI